MKTLHILAAAMVLSGCVTSPRPEPKVWVRTDGQKGSENPALAQQFEIDKAVCLGDTQKSAAGMAPIYYQGLAGAIQADRIEGQRSEALEQVMQGCMAGKGYVYVAQSKAEETATRLRSTSADRAKSEARRVR